MNKYKKALVLALIFLLCCTAFLLIFKDGFTSVNSLKYRLLELGVFAPFVFILLCIFKSFIFLPCGLLSVAGGMLYGPLFGGMLSLAGFTVNALVVYHMAGYFGRAWVKKLLKDKFDVVDNFINRNSFTSILYLRIVPLLPFDAVSCLGGISSAKRRDFVFATVLGSIPGVLLYTYFGDTLTSLSWQRIAIPGAIIAVLSFVPLVQKFIQHKKFIKKPI